MKPILFSTQMVQAILDGRKTQTRRGIKPQPIIPIGIRWQGIVGNEWCYRIVDEPTVHVLAKSKYEVGDILYVRETWAESAMMEYFYKANGDERIQPTIKWRPSIHMPAAAARLFLKVTAVRAERLQDITEADAIAEGCQSGGDWSSAPTTEFSALWQSIYGPESVNDDPWVWAYTFERCDAPTIHRSQFTVHNSPLK
jgi:hypothetical protein